MEKEKFREFLIRISLVVLGSLVFYLAHPNVLVKSGIGFLGFFIYLPVFMLVSRCSFRNVWLYGGLYGFLSYLFFAFWLTKYHFLTLVLVCFLYFVYCAVFFVLLKFAEWTLAGNWRIPAFLFIACAYEYLKTLGFLGFSYGVSAYTQWKFIPFIQIAGTGGVFALNLIIILPDVIIWNFFESGRGQCRSLIRGKRGLFVGLSAWCVLFAANLLYGWHEMSVRSFEADRAETVKVIAVQNNETPWKNGLEEHKKNVSNLIEITKEALQKNPDADFVVWPETSVAPSIIHHFYSMKDMGRLNLVVNLLNYINSRKQVFVIGNAHEEYEDENKKIFNNALVFVPRENTFPPEPEMYTKIHLVPVSESFPFEKQFPHIYKKLLQGNTHFWEEGKEYKVFTQK